MKSYFKIFEFVSNKTLKKNLILDYKEVLTCLKRKAYKGAVVLTGGIVEAILLNRTLNLSQKDRQKVQDKYSELIPEDKKNIKIERMDLYYLIKSLDILQIITTPQASRCDVLRDYRNLIHPFKKGDRPSKDDAMSVKNLLDDLIIEFGKEIEEKLDTTNKADLFLTHSAYKQKREKIEYKEILKLFCKENGVLTFEELLILPIFNMKENPSKSLIACLNYLKDCNLCSFDPDSWKGYPIKRYEKWVMDKNIQEKVLIFLEH